jgi:hypothetical protein
MLFDIYSTMNKVVYHCRKDFCEPGVVEVFRGTIKRSISDYQFKSMKLEDFIKNDFFTSEIPGMSFARMVRETCTNKLPENFAEAYNAVRPLIASEQFIRELLIAYAVNKLLKQKIPWWRKVYNKIAKK